MDLHGLVIAVDGAAEPWRRLYSDSVAVSTAVTFVHLAALVVAAGLALGADRATWRVARSHDAAERARHLAEVARTHPIVVGALGLVMASGVALALADLEAYALSTLFWAKMLLVAALLANGLLMQHGERAVQRAAARADARGEERAWRAMRRTSVASVALWLATLLAGTVLSNA